jgi:D-alanine-D-alanine ligase
MGSKQEPPGVVVLYNDSEEMIKGEARDLLAERGVIACARAVADALTEARHEVARVPFQSDVELALDPYPANRWSVFNLGEGLSGRLFEEARIAYALEAMGYCFTGSNGDAIACSSHKARAKQLLMSNGVHTPPGWLFRHPDEVERLSGRLPFPLIVKPVAEGGSIGLDSGAVVHTERALRDRVAYVTTCYRQAALAEAFVVGREFNIALWGDPPRVLPLAEVDFSAFSDPHERIVSFAAKWEEDSFEYKHTPVLCPAPVDARFAERLTKTARRAWEAIGCRGYARVDMRINEVGIPFVVEVNCNPDLSPDAGFYRAVHTAGYSYREMAVHILDTAMRQPFVKKHYGLTDRLPVSIGSNGQGWRFQFSRNKAVQRTLEFAQEQK